MTTLDRRTFLTATLASLGAAAASAHAAKDGQTPVPVASSGRIDMHHHFAPPAWIAEVNGRPLLQPTNTRWTPEQSIEDMTAVGQTPEGLFAVLSGCITISVDRGAGPHTIMERREGDVTGTLPYSRMTSPPGDTRAQEGTVVFAVHRDHFPAMIRECQGVTSILVHTMRRAFDRVDGAAEPELVAE